MRVVSLTTTSGASPHALVEVLVAGVVVVVVVAADAA